MTAVYLIAVGLSVVAWIAWTGLGPSSRVDGVAAGDGGIGGAEGGEDGVPSDSRWRLDRAVPVFLAAFGGLGLLLGWVAPGLSRTAELGIAAFGGVGLVVILCAPSRRRVS